MLTVIIVSGLTYYFSINRHIHRASPVPQVKTSVMVEKTKSQTPTATPDYRESLETYRKEREKDFLDKLIKYIPPEIDYSKWNTYKNETHGYSLKYPKGWKLDVSQANNVEDYKDSICCNESTLSISNGSSTWVMHLDALYTGGPGYTLGDFDSCVNPKDPVLLSGESATCDIRYEGPLSISGMSLYKKVGYIKSTKEVLFSSIGELFDDNTGVSVVFRLLPIPPSEEKRVAIINYKGSDIQKYMEELDGITLSLQGLK